jgi:peptide-methionine (S)-S-oxide reductase
MIKSFIFSTISFFALSSCAQNQSSTKNKSMDNSITTSNTETTTATSVSLDTATFGTGCFWCTEAIFQQLKGVEKVTSGYSGGHVKNPTYEEVCSKTTGHAECLSIVYDKTKISFDELLQVFWQVHDPTTLNRQGGDAGPQYRSVIFYNIIAVVVWSSSNSSTNRHICTTKICSFCVFIFTGNVSAIFFCWRSYTGV